MDTSNPKYRDKITTEYGIENLILDLGVGNRKMYPNSVGLDMVDFPQVDVIADATKLIPLPNNSVVHCYSYHVLEHIPKGLYTGLFRETYRVCAPGAKIDWWFPYWTHKTAYDFSHITLLNEYCFNGSGFQGLFEIDKIEYTYEDIWKDKTPAEKEFARIHYINAVKEMRIVFHPRKDK